MATPRMQPMYDFYMKLKAHPIGGDFFQCAVRASMTLRHVGVYDPRSYRACGYATSHGWALRAEELYQWLWRKSSLGAAQIIRCTRPAQVPRRHGIIYLRNCFRRKRGARYRTGDHMDLMLWFRKSGPWILSALRWPKHCTNDIILNCADGKIRFWPCLW